MTEYKIHSVIFEHDSLVIGYIELPTDVRVEGQAILQRQMRLMLTHPDYSEDAVRLEDRVVRVLRNALEDFTESAPYEPGPEPDSDDDEKGMGED